MCLYLHLAVLNIPQDLLWRINNELGNNQLLNMIYRSPEIGMNAVWKAVREESGVKDTVGCVISILRSLHYPLNKQPGANGNGAARFCRGSRAMHNEQVMLMCVRSLCYQQLLRELCVGTKWCQTDGAVVLQDLGTVVGLSHSLVLKHIWSCLSGKQMAFDFRRFTIGLFINIIILKIIYLQEHCLLPA